MSSDTVRYIDTSEFTRLGSGLSGQASLQGFHRFCEGLPEQGAGAVVNWSLKGSRTSGGQSFIQVALQGAPVLQCQRCMEPFVYPIDVVNRVEIVANESDLDDEDDDEEAVERMVGSRRFDVMSFIEDELILAVPYVPRHEVCPNGPTLGQADPVPEQNTRPSPFSVLAQLKQNR